MAEEMSASARKRAAKKARDAAAKAEAEAPAAAAPKAAAKPKAAAEPEPKAKAKAKAQPKAAAEPEPKAKAKAKAQPKAAEAAEPKAQAKSKAEPKKAAEKPKAEAKSAPKAAAKGKAKPEPKEEEEPVRKGPEPMSYSFDDDGTGGDWEKSSGLSKKAQKQKDAKTARESEAKAMGFANADQAMKLMQKAQQIPGFNPIAATGGKTGVGQGLEAGPALVARIQAEAALKLAQAAGGAEAPEVKANTNTSTVQVPCPPEKIGRIVGPKGATLKMITEKTGVDRIDTTDGMVTIIGDADAVRKAEIAVKEMIDKGFMSLAYDNFNEQTVMVHPTSFPQIIGPKGAIIMAIKSALKVEINIPQGIAKDSKGTWGRKKHPISIAGAGPEVEKAKEVINDIVYYGHHPITHEGVVHEELEIEEWQYRFIIGPKGSEMRHLQNSFKVSINIPRDNVKDTGANPNVLIVGLPNDVARAQKSIEKILYNAEHASGGNGREDKAMGDDRDGNDELDPIAAQYLYKRK